MPTATVAPNVISYSAVISSCGPRAAWQQSLALLRKLAITIAPNDVSYNATINTCERAGQWQEALDVFSSMAHAELRPTAVTFGSLMNACAKMERWQLAMHLFADMPTVRVRPDVVNFSVGLAACGKGGQWQLALRMFQAMTDDQVSPNLVSYNALFDCLHETDVGPILFRQARPLYTGLLRKGITTLDLHDMSAGAAWLAVRWWFSDILPHYIHPTARQSGDIITGWGKSRPIWSNSDINAFVSAKLHEHRIPAEVPAGNRGLGRIALRVRDRKSVV